MGAAGLSSCTGDRVKSGQRSLDGGGSSAARWSSSTLCLGSRQPLESNGWATGCLGARERHGESASSSSQSADVAGKPVAAQYARIDHLEQQINLLETRRQLVRSLMEGGRRGSAISLLPESSPPRSLDAWAHDLIRERNISEAGITHDELVEALVQASVDAPGVDVSDGQTIPTMTAEELRQSWHHILERVRDGLDERANDLRTELLPLAEDVKRTERLIEDAFSKIDREHKGFITKEDLRDLCETSDSDECAGEGASALAERLFAELDLGHTGGRVSRDDFRLLMNSGVLDLLIRQIDRKKEERQRYRYFPPSLDRWSR